MRPNCGSSFPTRSRTTSCAGRDVKVDRSESSPSSPKRAARQRAAWISVLARSGSGTPAAMSSTARSTSARNSAAMSSTLSSSGHESQMRSFRWRKSSDGRMSKYAISRSGMTPDDTIRSRTSRYSSAVWAGGRGPVAGQRLQIRAREEA